MLMCVTAGLAFILSGASHAFFEASAVAAAG